jgi:hypothetical protein
MEMKNILIAMVLGFTSLATCLTYAHDEGHGPKLSDTGKFGGLVSGVVLKSDTKLGGKATLIYKSELARSSDGTVRLYIYDQKMKSLDLKNFNNKAMAVLASKVKGKWKNTEFQLESKNGSFLGKMPKPETKPYNIDVVIKEGDKELLTAFDNLD